MLTAVKEGEEREWSEEIFDSISSTMFQINEKLQATDPGSSEEIKQNKNKNEQNPTKPFSF